MAKIINFKKTKKKRPNTNYNIKKNKHINPLFVIGIICLLSFLYYVLSGKLNETVDVASFDFASEDIYSTIYKDLSEYKTDIYLQSFSQTDDNIPKVMGRILEEHPELFWVNGAYTGRKLETGATASYMLSVETRCTINEAKVMSSQLENIVADIVNAAIASCSNDYEKALYVHDYLVRNCEYDVDTYNKSVAGNQDGNSMSYTAYGCLVNHKAVCEGYTKAYMLILTNLNIEAGYISGFATNSYGSGPHAWNYIKLDGKYHMVDVTWDDPVGYTGNDIFHEYFCLSTEEMLKDHVIDFEREVPECLSRYYEE